MKMLLIGFSKDEVEKVKKLGYDVLPVSERFRKLKVSEILESNPREGSAAWTGERFVIMHEPTNEEIKRVMEEVRELFSGRVIFATTTETNLKWTLEELLNELRAEDEYFRAMREAKRLVGKRKGLYLDIGNVK